MTTHVVLVAVDGKKKETSKVLHMSKASKDQVSSSEEEEEESEDEDDPDYSESHEEGHSESDGRSDSEEDFTENEKDAKDVKEPTLAEAMIKTSAKQVKKKKPDKNNVVSGKRKSSDQASDPKKKKRKFNDERKEKTFTVDVDESKDQEAKDDQQGSKGKGKKEMPAFSDKNVDYDLFHNSATNVVPRRIKLSNNLVVTCRMVEQIESKNITNDYPALTFQRKTAGEKCFEFILPLNLGPKITEAINLIVKDNAKFFANSSSAN